MRIKGSGVMQEVLEVPVTVQVIADLNSFLACGGCGRFEELPLPPLFHYH